jgi:hypothetical protein
MQDDWAYRCCGHCERTLEKLALTISRSMIFVNSIDIFSTDSVDEGYTVPYVEDGEPMKAKVSQAGEIMISLRCRKLRNSLLSILLSCISREVSSASKDRKRGLKESRLQESWQGHSKMRC